MKEGQVEGSLSLEPFGCQKIINAETAFSKLQSIAYREMAVDGVGIRISGIHFMDSGPEWDIKKHRHSFYEFHYVLKDNVLTTIGNSEQDIREGFFYLMSPGTFHAHRQVGGRGHIGFALRWEFFETGYEAGVHEGSREMSMLTYILREAHSKPVQDQGSVAGRMHELLQAAEDASTPLELQMLFCRILVAIGRYYAGKAAETTGKDEFLLRENNTIHSALRFLQENYMQDIRVEDVARSVHISYSQLARLFRKHTGETVNRHLCRIRLGKAQKLLACSDKSLAQIAQEVGIDSEHYFCTLFRQSFGMSPGAYRNGKIPLQE